MKGKLKIFVTSVLILLTISLGTCLTLGSSTLVSNSYLSSFELIYALNPVGLNSKNTGLGTSTYIDLPVESSE